MKKKEKWSFKSELKRKGIHLLSLLFLLSYVLFGDLWGERIALLLLTLLLILFLELEFVRLKTPIKLPLIGKLWREKEKNRVGGQVFFLIGAIISLAVFDFRIAFVAILMTTFGDLAAAIVGIKFGKNWLKYIPDRAWEGIFAEFAVDIIIGLVFLPSWIVAAVMALTATFVETVFTHADDNLMIPVFSGFNGQVVLMALKYYNIIQ